MGKRKKSKSSLNLFNLAAIILGVVALCMIAVASLTVKGSVFGLSGETNYSGLKAVFGYKDGDTTYLLFSFLNLLPYLFVLASVVILAMQMFGKANSSIMSFVVFGLFVASGVLFLFAPAFTNFSEGYQNAIDLANTLTKVVTKELGIGAIISACASFAAGLCVLLPKFIKK